MAGADGRVSKEFAVHRNTFKLGRIDRGSIKVAQLEPYETTLR
jgi:hypothetical protein